MGDIGIQSMRRRQDVCLNDVMCAILGLRDIQSRIYWSLETDLLVEEVAKNVGRDRTSVQKALNDLVMIGLATRRRVESRRGRKYIYRSVDTHALRKKLREELDAYYGAMKAQIDSVKKPTQHARR